MPEGKGLRKDQIEPGNQRKRLPGEGIPEGVKGGGGLGCVYVSYLTFLNFLANEAAPSPSPIKIIVDGSGVGVGPGSGLLPLS